MKENNKGRRRRLELELAAAREKNLAANRELALMREKLRAGEQGIAQVRRTVDMLLTAAALNCGTRVGERAWELVLPGVGPGMLEQWALYLTVEAASGDYILRLSGREAK